MKDNKLILSLFLRFMFISLVTTFSILLLVFEFEEPKNIMLSEQREANASIKTLTRTFQSLDQHLLIEINEQE